MRKTIFILLSFLAATALQAQMSQNLARGFDPEKVYQIGDIDNVNLFNGNLIIDIPIGPTFPVAANLSYGFHLVYNGNPWDYETFNQLTEAMPSRFNNVAIGWQLTMGELVAPKDLLSGSLEEDGNWIYAGPDGSERPFFPSLHKEEENTSYAVPSAGPAFGGIAGYTRDASYLRLIRMNRVSTSGGCRSQYRIDFPNGIQHIFQSTTVMSCSANTYDPDETTVHYHLVRIQDPFNNWVTIDYTGDPVTSETITDSTVVDLAGNHRTHTISLVNDRFYGYSGDQQRSRVTSVSLAGPGGTPSTYSFDITNLMPISLPCGDQTVLTDRQTQAHFLTAVRLPDDTTGHPSRYSMVDSSGTPYYTLIAGYDSQGHVLCSSYSAHINRIDLPAGGHIEYEMDPAGRRFPYIPDPNFSGIKNPEDPGSRGSALYSTSSIAIGARKLFANSTSDPAIWKYGYDLFNTVLYVQYSDSHQERDRQINQEMAIWVTDPAHKTTMHYFDVLRDELEGTATCYDNGTFREYGLPYARSLAEDGLYRSTESFDGDCTMYLEGSCPVPACKDASGTTLKARKRTYVKYDFDTQYPVLSAHWGDQDNHRVQSSRSQFFKFDTNGNEIGHTDTTETGSAFDGLGHYRTQTTASTVPSPDPGFPSRLTPDRVVTTHYNANANAGTYPSQAPSQYMIDPTLPWITGVYNYLDATESLTSGTHTARQEFAFDGSTGFLNQRRTLANGTTEDCTKDLLTIFTKNQQGNLTKESYYGGYPHDLCSSVNAPYAISHTYNGGSLESTSYDNAGFLSEDYTIDPYTGLVAKARDSAGQETAYTYDSLYRVTQEQQPSVGSTTNIAYPFTSPRSVTVDRKDAAGSTLTQQVYYYDGLGRMIESKALMPNGQWAMTVKKHDNVGRVSILYQPEYRSTSSYEAAPSNTNTTEYTYDWMGRTTLTKLPDGSQLTQTYAGAEQVESVTKDSNGQLTPPANDHIESFDGYGRLINVQEPSGTSNALVTTRYKYDVGNRLISVTTDGETQSRSFAYDDRGLLTSETHPELGGVKSYTNYDARGHAHNSAISAIPDPVFSLTYDYAPAERLTTVTGAEGVLKQFVYGTANSIVNGVTNYKKGRLDSATRHNFVFGGVTTDVSVQDSFEYDALGRIAKKNTTIASTGGSSSTSQTLSQTYTLGPLGETTHVFYPTVGNAPARDLAQSFAGGLLTGVTSFTAAGPAITYHPTGLVNAVAHADGSTDTIAADPSGMARPGSILFDAFTSCTIPQPVVSAPSTMCPNSSDSAMVVNAPGSTYFWTISGGQITGGASTNWVTFNAGSSGSVTLSLTIANNCGSRTFVLSPIPVSGPMATVSGSATIAAGQSTDVHASLTGTGPWTVTWSDGFSQTVPAGSGAVATHTVAPQATTHYTVTSLSDSSCGGSSTGEALVTVTSVPAPSSVHAEGASDTSVGVSWSAVANATSYVILRNSVPVGTANATTFTFTDINLAPKTGYRYTVHAKINSAESLDSPMDFATTVTFDDDPQLKIRAVDVTKLRDAIRALRTLANLAPYTFTVGDTSLAGSVVRGIQIQELLTALNPARNALGFSSITITDGNVDPATNGGQHFPIRHAHITALREGAK